MLSSRRRFRIVVALDLSEYAEVVLEHAFDQAARHEFSDVHIVTVEEPGHSPPMEEIKRRLAELVAPSLHAMGQNGWRVRLYVRSGAAAGEIVGLAEELDADLIVMGRFGVHGAGRRWFMGSVADRVLKMASCPVFVVKLADHGDELARVQCPDCVEVRRDSDGERWFCAACAHQPGNVLSSVLRAHEGWGLGGPVW